MSNLELSNRLSKDKKHIITKLESHVDRVILLASAAAALFLGLSEALFAPTQLNGREVGLAIALLGAIAAHTLLHRSQLTRLELVMSLIAAATTELISRDRSRRTFAGAMSNFTSVQDLKYQLREKGNDAFAAVADDLLAPAFEVLEGLARGQVNVPENLIMTTFSSMLEAFHERFDAVSNDDLEFWLSNKSVAPRYLSQNVAAVRRGLLVTRLFIVPERQICESTLHSRLCEVISHQAALGIEWGLAIAEDLEPGLPPGPLDFALFDAGKAMSTFRREGERRFVAIIDTDGVLRRSDERIANQRVLYTALLTEVWLASGGFAAQHLGHKLGVLPQIEADTKLHNKRAQAARGDKLDHTIFPFIAQDEGAVKGKLDELATTYRTYRTQRLAVDEGCPNEARPNFTLKLLRPGFGPAAELPTSSQA